jgi:hypothetical protein
MRRIFVHLVLLVIAWGYVAPAAVSATEAELPACCRGNGKHHCAMVGMSMVGMSNDGGAPGVRSNSPQCPYRLLGSLLNRSGVAETKKSFSLELPFSNFFARADRAFYLSGGEICNSGRSPPALSL